jgi:hypothetical protein
MSVDMCDNDVKEFRLIVISKSLGKSFGFVYLTVGEMTFQGKHHPEQQRLISA